MSKKIEGGCLCGAIHYEISGDPAMSALCHCASCRRSTGAPMVAWSMYTLDQFHLSRGEVSQYASSEGVERGFCRACGTTLTYTAEFLPGLIDVTIASFNEPSDSAPHMHIWEAQRLPWVKLGDELPRHEALPPQ